MARRFIHGFNAVLKVLPAQFRLSAAKCQAR